MTLEQLIGIAEGISLPCYLLNENNSGRKAAYWGGCVTEDSHGYYVTSKDIITLDGDLLEELGISSNRRVIKINEKETEEGETSQSQVEMGETLFSEVKSKGDVLYAHKDRSLPPFEAVCLYGGSEIWAWLSSKNIDRWDYDVAIQRSEELQQYREYFRRHSHELREDIDAVVGGWHIRWSDDDYYIPREAHLGIWTFRDAEPWYEVFFPNSANLFIRKRIT